MAESSAIKPDVGLFNIVPGALFSPLSRKYKAVYAYALITLYRCLKLDGSHILKSDYMEMLRADGQDFADLFNIARDKADDNDGEDSPVVTDESDKFAYVVRKLASCGWFQIIKDFKTREELIFLPPYAIKLLEVIRDLVSRDTTYIPLVHQTYSELSLEDKEEDEYMYRSLANAMHNTEQLQLSVTLLHHSIVVYSHRLVGVNSANDALHQHFDDFRSQVSDPIYHPMKTYDSFGLYTRPIVEILSRWLKDERIVAKLASQARLDPANLGLSQSDATDLVIRSLNSVMDVFKRINQSFDQIDRVNSDYTEAVQRKVNYLSGSDRSVKGKIDRIIARIAEEVKKHPNASEDSSKILELASACIDPYRMGIFKPESLYMPFKREKKVDEEPMGLMDDMAGDDSGDLMEDFISSEVSQFSDEAIDRFMRQAFAGRPRITSTDIPIASVDDLILLILAIVRSEYDTSFFTSEKMAESVVSCGYRMPLYSFVRKER